MKGTVAQVLRRGVDWLFGRQRRLSSTTGVLLTFDDGPDPVVTPQVLDRLKVAQARAVFFVVGNRLARAPDIPAAILAAGHYLGNHSYAHRLDRDPWLWAYVRDVVQCQRALHDLTGRRPQLFRAPMGRSSLGALVTPRLVGLRHVLWSVEASDWAVRDLDAAQQCADYLCRQVQGGDIVLLHDDNPWVLPILDILLPFLHAQGFDLCPSLPDA